MKLEKEMRVRYSRNISVDGFGVQGQEKLLDASVCVVGCGALGSIAAAYLTGAGVGRLTVADFDTVDISNLQRQLTFTESDCGSQKADALAARLRSINSGISVKVVNALVTPRSIGELIAGHDFVIDASDNPDTKYMIDEACFKAGIPYTIGGVLALRGQVMTWRPGTARYPDFFPESAGAGYTPCSIGGVLGPIPGIVGSIQALEAIKSIVGMGRLLTDRLLLINGATMSVIELPIS